MRIFKRHFFLLGNTRVRKLSHVGFIQKIAMGMVATIWALYLKELTGKDLYVGLIGSALLMVSLLSYFLIIPIVEKADKLKTCVAALIIISLGFTIYFFISSIWIFILVAIALNIALTLNISSFGLLIQSNSKKRDLSKNEGYLYTIYNISFFIGPLIVALVTKQFDLRYIFLLSAVLIALSALILKSTKNIVHGGRKKTIDKKILSNFKSFFRNKERVKSYFLGGGVNFWWSFVYIYTPLILIKWSNEFTVALTLSLSTIPLILLEYYFGRAAGIYGYKKLFAIGYIIPSLCALVAFFFFTKVVLIMVVIIASIGMAMLESNTESYFFDIMKGKEAQRYYAPYNTAIDAGSILGKIAPSIVLIFLEIKYVLLVFAFGTAFLAILSLTIKDVIENR